MAKLQRLLEEYEPAAGLIHDVNTVATMQAHNVRRLLTHNVKDFVAFAGLIELIPLAA